MSIFHILLCLPKHTRNTFCYNFRDVCMPKHIAISLYHVYTHVGCAIIFFQESRAFLTCLYKKFRAFVYATIDMCWLLRNQPHSIIMHGCRPGLVPSIIGKDHGQISIECAHHSLVNEEQPGQNNVCFEKKAYMKIDHPIDPGWQSNPNESGL